MRSPASSVRIRLPNWSQTRRRRPSRKLATARLRPVHSAQASEFAASRPGTAATANGTPTSSVLKDYESRSDLKWPTLDTQNDLQNQYVKLAELQSQVEALQQAYQKIQNLLAEGQRLFRARPDPLPHRPTASRWPAMPTWTCASSATTPCAVINPLSIWPPVTFIWRPRPTIMKPVCCTGTITL